MENLSLNNYIRFLWDINKKSKYAIKSINIKKIIIKVKENYQRITSLIELNIILNF